MTPIYHFYLQVQGPDLSRTFEISLGITSIGREPGSTILLANSMVSRRHAQVVSTGDECQLTDLGSANGTLLNGEKLTSQVPVILEPGAVITIAAFQLIFQRVQEEEILPAPQESEVLSAVPSPNLDPQPPEGEPVPALDPALSAPARLEPLPTAVENSEAQLFQKDGQAAWMDKVDFPPGLSSESLRLIQYLPGIYQTAFMSHFLALFESILLPIEWEIDHFDLYLDPGTAPAGFLPWLANWFSSPLDPGWDEYQVRLFLKDAYLIYARMGTRWALSRMLEIYTGVTPEISEFGAKQDPYTFTVRLHPNGREIQREAVEKIIAANKPVYTGYQLEILT
jgi:phage tail-like protein